MDTREILLEIRAMVEHWKAKAEFLEKQLNVIGGTGECGYWRERAEHAERERDVLKIEREQWKNKAELLERLTKLTTTDSHDIS